MPTFVIAAGTTSQPHNVPAGAIVKIYPAAGASAVVEYTKDGHAAIKNGVATWLPWPKGPVSAEVSDLANNAVYARVTANGGAVTLDVDGAPTADRMIVFRGDWGAHAQLTSDANGNTTAVASSGGVIDIAAKIPGMRAVLLGDSLLGQEYTVENTSPSARSTAVGRYSATAKGMVNTLNALLGRPFEIIYYGGVTGTTTTQILARTAQAFASQFDILFEDGGTNDITLCISSGEWGGSLSAAEDGIVANRMAVWAKARGAGCGLINALAIPAVASGASWTNAQRACALRVNRRLRDAAKNYLNVRFHDLMEASVDPASATGLAKANIFFDGDKHHNSYGAYLYAKKIGSDSVIAGLARKRAMVSSALDCIQNDTSSKNLLNTATGLGTGTPITAVGTGATGTMLPQMSTISRLLGTTATTTNSVVSAPSGVGNAQRIVVSGASAADQIRAGFNTGATTTELPKGSWGYFEAMVKVTGASGCLGISIGAEIAFTGGALTSPLTSYGLAAASTDVAPGIGDETFTLVSEPVYFPADATTLTTVRGYIYVTFGQASGGATVDVYQAAWIKL